MIRTYEEALAYINDFTWSTSRLGLDRTRELLKRLGDPQKKLRFVHVAGTNGKGSTCAMTERILREAGYRTGLYPSPYIEDFRERIQVNGEYVTEESLIEITDIVASAADDMTDHPSQFELITAIGMLYFYRQNCDFVVLEVGMGGALDSTNVIDAPEVAVITNIGLDHTEYLGDTIEKIALTKCGIIKPGCTVVSYPNEESVMKIIRKTCKDKDVLLYEAEEPESVGHDLYGQVFRSEGNEYKLSLLGKNQLRNAAVVLCIVDALRDRGFVIPQTAVSKGFADTKWPARFEVLCHEPVFILDGGHNPQCAETLAENIDAYLLEGTVKDKRSITFLIGMLRDKDYLNVLQILKPYGKNYICITPDNTRALSGKELAEIIRRAEPEEYGIVESFDSVDDAIRTALKTECPVVGFGSLYSAGTIRKEFRKMINQER